jgi:hypothetical protein
MARLPRAEVFDPNEVAVAHVFNRTVRRCFLMGDDALSGKNFDHRDVPEGQSIRQRGMWFLPQAGVVFLGALSPSALSCCICNLL